MRAITVEPKKPGTVRYEDFPEPDVCAAQDPKCHKKWIGARATDGVSKTLKSLRDVITIE
jgi:hypothetical protein